MSVVGKAAKVAKGVVKNVAKDATLREAVKKGAVTVASAAAPIVKRAAREKPRYWWLWINK